MSIAGQLILNIYPIYPFFFTKGFFTLSDKALRRYFMKKYNGLKKALLERAKAKNEFIKISNNKKSKKKEIIEYYKQYIEADKNLISIYEGIKNYDNVA